MWLGVDRHDSSVPNTRRSPDAEGDVQLGEERGGRAVGVDRADDAVLAAPPPVAQQRTERVASLDDEVGDVERLHLEPLAVRGEPGVSSCVADAGAVDERLVDPVRGDVQDRGRDRTVDRDLAGQVVRRAMRVGRVGGFDRFDPRRDPCVGVRDGWDGDAHEWSPAVSTGR